ncbi:MAG: plasmid pRiA4b ORF-3 family protein [Lentimicrobium sp.]|nr:plasmid pRiA4b ORF-3 family protein [Lentimicrobium sp.]
MHAYRFRMLHEDQDDFLRDFDILSSQTFYDFHKTIKESVELQGNELASFFVCDRNWRKKKEITLINMKEESQEPEDEDDRRSPRQSRIPVCEMVKVRIKDIIDDPHQRLLYEYDFLNPKVFFIELSKIVDADKGSQYPVCIKSTGKFVTATIPLIPDNIDLDEEDVALVSEFDDIMDNDDNDIAIFEAEPEF